MEWISKYIFRLGHIAPVIAVGGKAFIDYITYPNMPLNKNEKWSDIFDILVIVMGVCGFVNSMILKPKKTMKEKRTLWSILIHVKLLFWLLYINKFTSLFISDQKKIVTMRCHTTIFWVVVSPFLRYYREYWTAKKRDEEI
jgi:dipeptide/tripeptide permease